MAASSPVAGRTVPSRLPGGGCGCTLANASNGRASKEPSRYLATRESKRAPGGALKTCPRTAGRDYLIFASLNSTFLRSTGSYFLKLSFSVLVLGFFLVP